MRTHTRLALTVFLSLLLVAGVQAGKGGGGGGIPLSETPLGDDLGSIDVRSEVDHYDDELNPVDSEDPEATHVRIKAIIGVDACGVAATDDAIGECDIPEELLCDSSGKRVCDDCANYINTYDGGAVENCLKAWLDENYGPGLEVDEYCFRSESNYTQAHEVYCEPAPETP